ncbi:ATP-binding protein [Litorimonas sp. RW-G-Af-16]|uniref:ATP-binding protein n=1 Tax=Litorimonas sp. RW-G-Af-16 TaxID=3241168 RepID=UPI00390CA8DF
MTMPFKRYLPKSLYGRASAIIITPIVIMQMAVAYFFFNAHWSQVTANLSDSVAADIAVATQLYSQAPSEAKAEELDALLRPDMQLSIKLRPGDDLPEVDRQAFFSVLDRTLRRALNQTLDDPFWFDTTRYPNHIDIRVKVDEGVLRFVAARERVFAPTGFVFIFWLITATVLLTLVSIIFIRNQAKPIRQLADAADAFGKGQDISTFKPSGASEVRRAGQSFLKMRARIQRHLEQRTMMLAGVSHDLRTPLTRLKLQIAMQDETEDTRAAKRDIAEMEAMLTGYLDFARGLGNEKPVSTALPEFLTETLVSFPDVSLKDVPDITLPLRTALVRRALVNLIHNARKYAKRCEVCAETVGNLVLIHVDDDGPGIPEDDREEAFKAFQRLDVARNQNVEGVGLGLSIARDIAQIHGGKLVLDDSPLGGLRATLALPR